MLRTEENKDRRQMTSMELEKKERKWKDGRTVKKSRLVKSSAGPDILVVKSSAGVVCDVRSEKKVERPHGEKGEQEPQHPQCLNMPEEIVRLNDRELNEKIRILSTRFKCLSSTLPGKGAKLNAYLKKHEEEKQRREQFRSSEPQGASVSGRSRRRDEQQESQHRRCLNGEEAIVRLDDRELNEKIRTLSGRLKGLASSLPDKGATLKAFLKKHEEEKQRRERFRSSEPQDATVSGSSRRRDEQQDPQHRGCLNGLEEIVRLDDDREFNEKIQTLSDSLKGLASSLPDKGAALKAFLKKHEEEKQSRERFCPLQPQVVMPTDWLLAVDTPVPGGPSDTSLLRSFGGHIALDVWQGQERGCLDFVTRGHLLHKWKVEDLIHPSSKAVVANSGLVHLHEVVDHYFDLSLISAFVERWQPDTNTFHLPFGEMTITLHDVFHILHIPIEGKAVAYEMPKERQGGSDPSSLTLDAVLDVVAELFMVGSRDDLMVKDFYKDGVPYNKLREICSHPDAIYATEARAHLYYLIGCTLFPDKRNDSICPYTYWPLQDTDQISGYAWGTATLAYLYRQLGIASRADTKEICGCLTLLQCWIYEYFPTVSQRSKLTGWSNHEPHALKYKRHEGCHLADKAKLVEYRQRLDMLSAETVAWTPFGERSWEVCNGRSLWTGFLHMMDIVEPYHPNRCMRQFGVIQMKPFPPLWPTSAFRPKQSCLYTVTYPATPSLWNNCSLYAAPDFAHAIRVSSPWDAVKDYLEWYIPSTHPRISAPSLAVGQDAPKNIDSSQVVVRDITRLIEPFFPDSRPSGWIREMSDEQISKFEKLFDEVCNRLSIYRSRG